MPLASKSDLQQERKWPRFVPRGEPRRKYDPWDSFKRDFAVRFPSQCNEFLLFLCGTLPVEKGEAGQDEVQRDDVVGSETYEGFPISRVLASLVRPVTQLFVSVLDSVSGAWKKKDTDDLYKASLALDWKLSGQSYVSLREEEVESFTGKVEAVEGSIAHVTLVDHYGRGTFADCDAEELKEDGIHEGDRFTCIIKKRGRETVVTLKPLPRRQLSIEEQREIREKAAETLRNYNPNDDY